MAVDEPSTGGEPTPGPTLTPRQVRARRRRRRRRIGVAIFVVVAAGVIGAAYLAVAGSDDSSDASRAAPSSAGATTTTVVKPAGPYKVTTDVNIRQGPGTNFPTVGTVEPGHEVLVDCVAQGESVNGPAGPDPRWLRISGFGRAGYLTVIYVSVGDDLNVPGKIPACTT
jgi:uncharacterized protein YraI